MGDSAIGSARNEIPNLGADNSERNALRCKYKRAFFIDWRAADRLKKDLFPQIDHLLDTNESGITNQAGRGKSSIRDALETVVKRPFRVVPFFDPGPWGGEWMRRPSIFLRYRLTLPGASTACRKKTACVCGFGATVVDFPSLTLVSCTSSSPSGRGVHCAVRHGISIRFDFLDTMEGGNLSLQVHPLTNYIAERFRHAYTQDESYYLLDARDGALSSLD